MRTTMSGGVGMFGICSALIAALAGLVSPASGNAHLVTFDFTGSVVAADPHSLGGILTTPIGPFPASAISGSFTFDADTVDANPGNHHIGQYNGALTNLTLSVTNLFGVPYQFGFNSNGALNSIQVNADHAPADQSYIVSASVQNLVPSGPIRDGDDYFARDFFINLVKPSTEVFTGDALPQTPPGLSPFSLYDAITNPQGQWQLVFSSGHADHVIIGNLASMTPAVIPAPAAVYLFGTGIIGMAAIMRRRSRE
jgi:hypothetical protein